MKTKKRSTRKAPKRGIHIAVIVSETIDDVSAKELQFIPSRREHGDWAAFVGIDQEAVIRQAKEALDVWRNGPGAPYVILVGMLDGRAQFPTAFTVVPL
jgi:hypothetical protein